MEDPTCKVVAVTAPTNIAIIKYWGKRCSKLNLPLNSSLSVTLCQEQLKTTTTICTSSSFTEDEITLNGQKQNVTENKRLMTCLAEIRRMGRKQVISKDSCVQNITFFSQKVHITTENNFPTAAGLASSASGYAALVFGLGKLYGIKGDLTCLARQGSGSASRSLHGGFVEWYKGENDDGTDSTGIQLFSETHWPELRILVLVVNDNRKETGSTDGMQRSMETSQLLNHRVLNIVEDRVRGAKQAILDKNFPMLAEIMMKDSNQLHAICLDTFPPLQYLSSVSHTIINFVHAYNKACGSTRLAYTFDAGPNACLFTTENFADEVASIVAYLFSADFDSAFFRGLPIKITSPDSQFMKKLNMDKQITGLLRYVIHTRVGRGPQVLETKDHSQ